MAITNAEKQFRARARIKQRLALAAIVESFRAEMEDTAAGIREQDDFAGYGTADLLLDMLDGDLSMEGVGPFLAQALGLPGDPWPGLTFAQIASMTKGRKPEAKRRLGMKDIHNAPDDVGFLIKLRAAKNRAWLLGEDAGGNEVELAA